MTAQQNSRLLSVDILRGITIAGMILVNNPGSWRYMFAPLQHAPWHGLTPTDLIFPFFIFIMGISTYISLKKTNFECTRPVVFKILKRVFGIFFIGLALAWFGMSITAWNRLAAEEMTFFARLWEATTGQFDRIRILGVLPRLALTYGIAAIIAITVRHKFIPWIIGIVLLVYFLLLQFGNGFELAINNIVVIVDRAILTDAHMWGGLTSVAECGTRFRFEPEGILSTFPAAMQVLIGFMCGQIILGTKDNFVRIQKLFIVGAIMTFAGFLLMYGCPINKKLWTPTFVLVTSGMAATFLALLIWIIDVHGHKRWTPFFETFGINPLFLFVFATFVTILLGRILITVTIDEQTVQRSIQWIIYNRGILPIFESFIETSRTAQLWASFMYSLLFLGFNYIVGYILYKKRIYIKI